MTTIIYLVRHAHSTYTPDEWGRPLSEKGKEDAMKVADLLLQAEIDVVISSPYQRAIETVQGVAANFNKKIKVVEAFKERILTTTPAKDFTFAITKVWEDNQFSWPGGESNEVAQIRGVAALEHLLEQYKNKKIVIGTHGNLMVLIMNYYHPQYDFTFWKQLDMPDIYQLTFEGKDLLEVKRVWRREVC